MIGVGYRPRTGSIFFTRNGKKLDDVAHGLKSQNFFPTVGANGPCTVHVNFGQSGFVFIEANVKKWGLAPMTGSLAPPPPYGSEQGSILLEAGREGARQQIQTTHVRSGSRNLRIVSPTSTGPERSPTEISLAQLAHIPSNEDIGEGTSRSARSGQEGLSHDFPQPFAAHEPQDFSAPPPEYTSPEGSIGHSRRYSDESQNSSHDSEGGRGHLRQMGVRHEDEDDEDDDDDDDDDDEGDEGTGGRPLMGRDRYTEPHMDLSRPPIPSYEAAVRGRDAEGDYPAQSR